MSTSGAHTLQLANQRLQARLLAVRNPTLVPTGLTDLLDELLQVASTLHDHTLPRDSEFSNEVWSFRANLQQLAALLPSLRTRFLLEKARLEAARMKITRAAAWAEGSRETL